MSINRIYGIAALSALAVGTVFAVRFFVPGPEAQATDQLELKPRLRYTRGTRVEDPSTLPPRVFEAPKPWHGGKYQPLAFEATAVNDSIGVATQFRIYSKAPQPFVWAVWVFDLDSEERDLVFHHRYEEQLAVVPAGADLRPTFSDVIDMGPGRYYVRVAPLMVPPKGGLARLALDYDDDRTMEDVDESSWALAFCGGRVTVR